MKNAQSAIAVVAIYTEDYNEVLLGEHFYNGQSQAFALPRFNVTEGGDPLNDARHFVEHEFGSGGGLSNLRIHWNKKEDKSLVFSIRLWVDKEHVLAKSSSEVRYSFKAVDTALRLIDDAGESIDRSGIERTMKRSLASLTEPNYFSKARGWFYVDFLPGFSEELRIVVGWALRPKIVSLVGEWEAGSQPALDFAQGILMLKKRGYATIDFDPEGKISTLILLRLQDMVEIIIIREEDVIANERVPYKLFMSESIRALQKDCEDMREGYYRQENNEYVKSIDEVLKKLLES